MANRTLGSTPRGEPVAGLAELEHAGVDKIRFKYAVTKMSPSFLIWLHQHHGRSFKWGKFILPGGASEEGFLLPAVLYGAHNLAENSLTLEFNPSRMQDPDGSSLATIEETLGWCRVVIGALRDVFTPLINPCGSSMTLHSKRAASNQDLSGITITRLDIARDFHSSFPGLQIKSFQHAVRPYVPHSTLYMDKHVMTGISWGNNVKKNYRASIYNKSLRHDKDANGGWFRFEVQMYWKALEEAGLRRLSSLNDRSALAYLSKRWVAGGMDDDYSVNSSPMALNNDLEKLSLGSKKLTFLGYAWCVSNGIRASISPSVVRGYQAIAKKIGFQLGSPLDSQGTDVVHINFKTGIVEQSWTRTTSG